MWPESNLGELLDGCLRCQCGAEALDHDRPTVLSAFLDISLGMQAVQVVTQVGN